jgi:hypothetical protein
METKNGGLHMLMRLWLRFAVAVVLSCIAATQESRAEQGLTDDKLAQEGVVESLFKHFRGRFEKDYPEAVKQIVRPINAVYAASAVESPLEASAWLDVINQSKDRVRRLCETRHPELGYSWEKPWRVTVTLIYGSNLRRTFEQARSHAGYSSPEPEDTEICFASPARYCTIPASPSVISVWSKGHSGASMLVSYTVGAFDEKAKKGKDVTLVEWYGASLKEQGGLLWERKASHVRVSPVDN